MNKKGWKNISTSAHPKAGRNTQHMAMLKRKFAVRVGYEKQSLSIKINVIISKAEGHFVS